MHDFSWGNLETFFIKAIDMQTLSVLYSDLMGILIESIL